METMTKIEERRENVIAYAQATHESLERVMYMDHERFTTLYTETFRRLRDAKPSAIRIRRAFNRYNDIARQDDQIDIYAGVLILSIACDLDSDFDYLELPL